MGATAEKEERDSAGPSWLRPAHEKIDAVTNPLGPQAACTASVDDPCKDSKDTVTSSLLSMQGYVSAELDRLATQLKAVDKPSWQEALLEQCMDVALAVGGARVGEYLVEKAGEKFVQEAKAAAEFIKKSLEEGAPKGTKLAMEQLAEKESPDVDEFISAQKIGVVAMYQNAATSFLHSGRHNLKTTREVAALEESVNAAHLQIAAKRQVVASRDAYLTCLARGTLGTTKAGTTAMDGSGESGHAATIGGAMLGIDRGVLVAQVMVYDDVRKEPGVWGSYLNGLNEITRAQYEDQPLSAMRIPRQLICSVRGDMSDFVVNVDETGVMQLASGDGVWLEARARSAHPEVANRSREEQRRAGLQLLLADLRIGKIGHGEFR